MPICNKIPFRRRKIDTTIKDSERVWYYAPTQEVFQNYDDFFDRYIKCISMCWTCSLTGKSNLTFEDALKSEQEATELIRESFPKSLAQPLLWYAHHHCYRGRLDDLLNDIYCVSRDRYFIGEAVWYQKTDTQRIKGVIKAVEFDATGALDSKSGAKKGKNEPKSDEEDNTTAASEGGKKKEKIKPEEPDMPSPECYTYSIAKLSDPSDLITDLPHTKLSRPRTVGSRMKLKHFFKNLMELKGDKVVVRQRVILEYSLNKLDLKQFFAGPIPRFAQLPRKRMFGPGGDPNTSASSVKKEKRTHEPVPEVPVPKKKKRKSTKADKAREEILSQQETLKDVFEQACNYEVENLDNWKQELRLLTVKEIEKLKEAIKESREDFKEREKDKKKKEREEQLALKKPRDDLMCNDLKPLPEYKPLLLPDSITDDMFAEMLALLQFFTTFSELIEGKITFKDCVEAVMSKKSEDNGFVKILTAFLHIRAGCIDKEDGDEANPEAPSEVSNETYAIMSNKVFGKSIIALNKAYTRIRNIHAANPSTLPIDWMTISEVLRLNMTTAGYCPVGTIYATRAAERGGIHCYEDPVYVHLSKDSSIADKLQTLPIFSLSSEERLILFEILREQLLTFATLRNMQEDKLQIIPDLKKQLKQLKLADLEQEKAARIAGYGADENTKKNSISKKVLAIKSFFKSTKEGKRILNFDEVKGYIEEGPTWEDFGAEEIELLRKYQKGFVQEKVEKVNEEIFDAFCKTGYPFLGRDRAFRNYWYFDLLEILLIENVMDPGECDEPTPIKSDVADLEAERISVTGCTGDNSTCPVHNTEKRPRWMYLAETGGVDKLLEALNPRGFREIDLADVVTTFRPFLTEAVDELADKMSKFQKTIKEEVDDVVKSIDDIKNSIPLENGLSKDEPDDDMETDHNGEDLNIKEAVDHEESESPEENSSNRTTRSSSKNKKLKKIMVKDAVDFLGLSDIGTETYNEEDFKQKVKDFILKIEEEIHTKALGELTLNESQTREDFRAAFVEGLDTRPFLIPAIDHFVHCAEDHRLLDEDNVNECSTELQYAILAVVKIVHVVRMKYFDSPFITLAKPQKGKKDRFIAAPTFIQWQRSMLECESWSELAMYCKTFDSRIMWNLVKTSARCNICRKKVNVEESVSCDVCRLVYHLQCAPLEVDSRANYVCSKRCDRKIHPGRPKKPVLKFDYLSEDEMEQTEEEIHHKSDQEEAENLEADNNSSVENHNEDSKLRRRRNAAKKPVDYSELDGKDPSEERLPRKSTRKRTRKADTDDDDDVNFRAISMGLRNGRKTDVDVKKQLSECQKIVETCLKMEAGYPFSYPVNPKEAPGYLEKIKHPMDLRKLINNFKNLRYEDPMEVWTDCKLIFSNCREYNTDDDDILDCCDRLEQFMKRGFHGILGNVVDDE